MIRRYAQFWFLWKGLGLVLPPHFLYDFLRKMFFLLYSINWPSLIACLPLLIEMLGNMCIAIICSLVCDATYFEINLSFLIKPFSYMTKKSRNRYLAKERSFKHEIKSIFHHFQKPSIEADFLESESPTLNELINFYSPRKNQQNRGRIICLNLLNIWREIWRRSFIHSSFIVLLSRSFVLFYIWSKMIKKIFFPMLTNN